MTHLVMKKSFHRIKRVNLIIIGLILTSECFAVANQSENVINDLVKNAQTAMTNRKPQLAAELYEKAAGYGESAEAEIGMVRAYLLAGEFKKTIASANLVAAEHSDVNDTTALLAYLEDREGQTTKALTKLEDALKKYPDDVPLVAAYAEILIDHLAAPQAISLLDTWISKNPPQGDIYRLRARAALLTGNIQELINWRMKAALAYEAAGEQQAAQPLRAWLSRIQDKALLQETSTTKTATTKNNIRWPAANFSDFPLSSNNTSSGNGFVIDKGQRVITNASLVVNAGKDIWVRNGLGELRAAKIEKIVPDQGLALLRLITPYPSDWSLPNLSLQAPKNVRFCFVFGYPITDNLEASYPMLIPSVLVRTDVGVGNLMQISDSLGKDNSGSPVFDQSGHFIGMTLGNHEPLKDIVDRESILGKGFFAVRAEALRALLPKSMQSHSKRLKGKVTNPSVEELYEKLQPAVVSIIVTH